MELNNILFSFLFLFFGYFLNKYLLFILKKNKTNFLIDDHFKKPQAFHKNPTPRTGGILIFFLSNTIFLYLFFFKGIFSITYISFCNFFFLLGFLDDLKINIRPKFRLISMVLLLIVLVISNEFYINKTGLEFLDHLVRIDIFSLIFVCLCFLFIINGSNLIDGFNGLLGIHALIILTVLLVVNLINESDLVYILFNFCLSILIFLKFNFPKAQMFLGDSGAYFIGAFIAISTIHTTNLNFSISPFFICILLFYLFFEVFFSFFRKIFFVRKSPLFPDNKHLHMLLYNFILKKEKNKIKANYMVSIYINFIYLLLIIPGIVFMNDGLFCRYYFFSLLILYIYFYNRLYKKLK